MKKRLRRKLHVGEFAQKSCAVGVNLKQPPWPGHDIYDLDFGHEMHESGLCISVMGGRRGCCQMRGRVEACDGKSDHGRRPGMSEADIVLLAKYLREHPLVDAFWICKPRDDWYPGGDRAARNSDTSWDREFRRMDDDEIEIDQKLGADGPRCPDCKVYYAYTFLDGTEQPAVRACSRCRKPFTKTPL